MRHATKRKAPQSPAGKAPAAEPFVLRVIGGASRKILSVHKPRTVRTRVARGHAQADRCALCDAEIARFDRETFAETGRCQPCDQALEHGN